MPRVSTPVELSSSHSGGTRGFETMTFLVMGMSEIAEMVDYHEDMFSFLSSFVL